MLEIKTSGGAVKSEQAQRLGALAADQGKEVIYLFYKQPSQDQLDSLLSNILLGAGGNKIAVKFNYLFP